MDGRLGLPSSIMTVRWHRVREEEERLSTLCMTIHMTCVHALINTHTHTHTHTHSPVVEVEFQQPMYTVPESNGTATVCLESDIETKTDLQVTVTASEKTPVDAQGR